MNRSTGAPLAPVSRCRICGNEELVPVLNLGDQALTGYFPRPEDPAVPVAPLQVVKCHGPNPERHCGLLQLRHSCSPSVLYGPNYGYRSGLNRSMVEHLENKVRRLTEIMHFRRGDLVVDVGSNDGSLLSAFPEQLGLRLLGVDPVGKKFRHHYRSDIELVPEFFSAEIFRERASGSGVRLLTSVAMFYDLESPLDFMRQVASILASDGVWHFEQSYMPLMIERRAFDTICHEHLEYYSLRQICWMARQAGLKVLDVEFNEVNGGSFAVTACLTNSSRSQNSAVVWETLAKERESGLEDLFPYLEFAEKVETHSEYVRRQLSEIRNDGGLILGYGASTKGNVLLQKCDIRKDFLPAIAEVNPDKIGRVTPGTTIPIISESEAHAFEPDYLFVLPWHLRDNLLNREAAFLARGGKMLFPLPDFEVVSR